MPRLLVATDGSAASIQAARHAAVVTGGRATAIVLTIAHGSLGPSAAITGFDDTMVMTPEDIETMVQTEHRLAEDRVERTVSALGDISVTETFIVEGDPGTVICETAEVHDVDLIVLGSHDKGRVARLFLGSVSEHVLHHSNRPVLIGHAEQV